MDSEQTLNRIIDEDAAHRREAHGRHSLAFIASITAHAIIFAALILMLPQIERPHHDWVLAYLVEFDQPGTPGRGAGAGDAGASSPPAPAHDPSDLKSQSVISSSKPHARQPHRDAARAQAKPERVAPPDTAAIAATPVPDGAAMTAGKEAAVPASAGTAASGIDVASATAFGNGAGGGRGGDGSGGAGGAGSGSSFAHVEYGKNPTPPYPIEARRRAQHGTVLLRIEVGADGSVERVEVAKSSGFDALDDSAVETVRTRWRFVPARRDGVAVESWCEVPIRFALTEA